MAGFQKVLARINENSDAMKIKEPLDFGWKMKPLNSAKTDFTISTNGVYHLHIEHDILKDITPQMLEWWFKNIGGEIKYQGRVYSRYRVWHPLDHIHWELHKNTRADGSIGEGSYFRIVEAFGRNPASIIDSVEVVTKLDHTGICLVKKIFGLEIFSLEHWFAQVGKRATSYRSHMVVGSESRLGRWIFNRFIRPFIFTEAMGFAWLKHNVEEVGNFEFFLPDLYQKEMGRMS
jgi:hypothetical protein